MTKMKFRAWDVATQKMSYKVNLYSLNRDGFIDKAQIENHQIMRALGYDCVIMQYIGLAGNNGKDIYEGDIVKYKHSYHGGGFILGEVVFYPGKAAFVIEFGDSQYHLFGTDVIKQECKVMGNKFENEELLNK